MKRWTNGLPGATKRLGAIMALCGLSGSKSRMRADTHDGPEQIAPLQRPDTLMQLSRSLILEVHLVPHGRAIQIGTSQPWQLPRRTAGHGSKADAGAQPLAGCQSAMRSHPGSRGLARFPNFRCPGPSA